MIIPEKKDAQNFLQFPIYGTQFIKSDQDPGWETQIFSESLSKPNKMWLL